jgi:hypothetical protein
MPREIQSGRVGAPIAESSLGTFDETLYPGQSRPMHNINTMYRAGPKIPHASSDRRDTIPYKRAFAVPTDFAGLRRTGLNAVEEIRRSAQGSFANG